MIVLLRWWKQWTLGLILVGMIGCSQKVDRPYAPAEDRLLKLGSAYVNATNRLGRPPRNFDDLKASLEADATEDILRSPGDGEPYVIHWGVDYNALPPRATDVFTVMAYEKLGTNGKRYVLRFPRSVELMTLDQLQKAVFPPGQQPP
jgi:hypothetical protein